MQVDKEKLKLFVVQYDVTAGYAYFDITLVVEVNKIDTTDVTNIDAVIDIEFKED